MSQYLLDTHALLWLATDDDQLTAAVRELVLDADTPLWVSAASIWELAIKKSLGKLELSEPLPSFLEGQRRALAFRLLTIQCRDSLAVEELPWHHRDPFDRMLVAQAINRDLKLLSRDRDLGSYGVDVVWC